MELKVWVEGVVRVVCGLSLETSCQDVVIALAQAIGQTGRYILILKLRDTERQLKADDCPLQSLAQLGQQATDVQFILRRTGPSLSDGPNGSNTDTALPLLRHPEPKHPKHREPQKALSFNLGHLTVPRRTRENRAWSPSPRASPEPRASPIPFLDHSNPSKIPSSHPSKEEVFRQILQQQEKLRDLEAKLEALERETEVWQWRRSSTPTTGLIPGLEEELEKLELRLRQNEAELMHGQYWEEQLQAEMDKEQDMYRHLHQISSSLDNHNHRLQDLHAHSAHLGQNIRLESQRQSSRPGTPQPEEALRPLKEELHSRWKQGAELDASLTETERELQIAEARLQERCQMVEELNKEVRQCNLQQFIQQTGVPPAQSYTDLPQHEQSHSLLVATNYLCNAGILDEEQTDPVTVC